MTDKRTYTYPDGKTTPGMTDREARDSGFCPGCGYFVAGSENDEISIAVYGLCYECVEELREETGEYDDYYYE